MTGMEPPVWELIDDDVSVWDAFHKRFCFSAGTTPDSWPGITEPAGSVTFSLAQMVDGSGTGEWLRNAVNFTVVYALAEVVGANEPLLALNWQHASHRFWPHLNATIHASEMLGMNHVTPVPDGDYFAFVSEDLTLGTFGHPWEGTLCVWGKRLVEVLRPALSPLLPVVRTS